MSDTPRTDAAEFHAGDARNIMCVRAEFARQLERELVEQRSFHEDERTWRRNAERELAVHRQDCPTFRHDMSYSSASEPKLSYTGGPDEAESGTGNVVSSGTLKPCPFFGHAARFNNDQREGKHKIVCDCGSFDLSDGIEFRNLDQFRREIANRWNEREAYK
jgi:hypothetical protein